MKILGAHNSLTGYPTIGFLSWLLKPMTKCQTKNINDLAKAGVTCFDIRLWWENGWHFGHGLSEYSVSCSFDLLIHYIILANSQYNGQKQLYIRFLLERPTNRTKFIELCKEIEKKFPDVFFLPARDKYTWEILYSFGHNDDNVHEYHASVSGKGLLKYFPRLWNKKYGKNYELQEGINLIDFV